jgi:hypothetical protein
MPATTSSWAVLDADGKGVGSSSASIRSASSRRPIKEETPDLEIPRIGGVETVAVLFERSSRCAEHFRGPTQVARGERDLSLGNDAPRPRHGFFRAKGVGGTPRENLRSYKIAKLRQVDYPPQVRVLRQ